MNVGTCINTPIEQPEQEVCDGVDNDLNGIIDDVPPYGVPNGTVHCVGGAESVVCDSGFANGDGSVANGCETNVMTDPNNCGAIGVVVSIPNATGACVNGTAVLVSCHPSWHNANGSIVDGCELRADIYEPNDTMVTARSLSWGTIVANIAPAGNEDWYRYFADCNLFNPCQVRFQVTGGVSMQVFEDGIQVGSGPIVDLGFLFADHEYRIRITAPGFVTSYTLNAQS